MDIQEVQEKIENLLNQRIRPLLQRDGGDVIFRDFNEDGELSVELIGACCGCPNAHATLKGVIEETVRYFIPEVKSVKNVEPQ